MTINLDFLKGAERAYRMGDIGAFPSSEDREMQSAQDSEEDRSANLPGSCQSDPHEPADFRPINIEPLEVAQKVTQLINELSLTQKDNRMLIDENSDLLTKLETALSEKAQLEANHSKLEKKFKAIMERSIFSPD